MERVVRKARYLNIQMPNERKMILISKKEESNNEGLLREIVDLKTKNSKLEKIIRDQDKLYDDLNKQRDLLKKQLEDLRWKPKRCKRCHKKNNEIETKKRKIKTLEIENDNLHSKIDQVNLDFRAKQLEVLDVLKDLHATYLRYDKAQTIFPTDCFGCVQRKNMHVDFGKKCIQILNDFSNRKLMNDYELMTKTEVQRLRSNDEFQLMNICSFEHESTMSTIKVEIKSE